MSSREKQIVVLGAGLAGLTAAAYAKRHGVRCRVFEASSALAGLAASSRDENGFTCDVGAHIITNRLAASVGFSARCEPCPGYGESVWLRRRFASYPFGLAARPKYALSAIAARLSGVFDRSEPQSAAQWFRRSFGKGLADQVALPLLEAWSGVPAEQLAPAVGDKMPCSVLRTMYLRAMGRLTGRAISIGYSRTLPENPAVVHVYPSDGIGAMCHHMAAPLTEMISLESPVECIYVDNGRVTGVRANDRDHHADAVISTAPVHVLPRLLQGDHNLGPLAAFRYRPMTFINLMMTGRGLLPNAVVWTPENHFPFFRATETPLQTPSVAPEGKTIIAVDIGCDVGDEYWRMDDEPLSDRCLSALEELIPDARARYLGCRVVRTKLAYPVFDLSYEPARAAFARSTGIQGLASVGRNGEFDHLLMEDVYWRTRYQMRSVLRSLERGSHACASFASCETVMS